MRVLVAAKSSGMFVEKASPNIVSIRLMVQSFRTDERIEHLHIFGWLSFFLLWVKDLALADLET